MNSGCHPNVSDVAALGIALAASVGEYHGFPVVAVAVPVVAVVHTAVLATGDLPYHHAMCQQMQSQKYLVQ